jgi:hypothetical protein
LPGKEQEKGVGNIGPKSDHVERSDLARDSILLGGRGREPREQREREREREREGQGLKYPSVRLSMI